MREASTTDDTAIHALISASFGGRSEADLVESLRRDGDLTLSLVADDGHAIVGHIAFSQLKSPEAAVALAPLAVTPSRRRRGIAAALVTEGLRRMTAHGYDMAFVLGDPAYYGRFGFSAAAAIPYPSPYAGAHHMAVHLTDRRVAAAPVVYATAFAALG